MNKDTGLEGFIRMMMMMNFVCAKISWREVLKESGPVGKGIVTELHFKPHKALGQVQEFNLAMRLPVIFR